MQILFLHRMYETCLSCEHTSHKVLHIQGKSWNIHRIITYRSSRLSSVSQALHVAKGSAQHQIPLPLISHGDILMLCGTIPVSLLRCPRIYPYLHRTYDFHLHFSGNLQPLRRICIPCKDILHHFSVLSSLSLRYSLEPCVLLYILQLILSDANTWNLV